MEIKKAETMLQLASKETLIKCILERLETSQLKFAIMEKKAETEKADSTDSYNLMFSIAEKSEIETLVFLINRKGGKQCLTGK